LELNIKFNKWSGGGNVCSIQKQSVTVE